MIRCFANPKAFRVFVILNIMVCFNQALGQDTMQTSNQLRNQVEIGFFFDTYNENFDVESVNVGYRRFFKKHWYYNIGMDVWYDSHIYNENRNYSLTSIPYGGIGLSGTFLKYFRGFAGTQIIGYFLKEHGYYYYNGYNYEWNDYGYGIFIGPEFALEIVPVRFKKGELSLFGKIHVGFGYLHTENTLPPNYWHGLEDEEKNEFNGVGGAHIGISYRFR